MKLGVPTRGFETDGECPGCGSSENTKRQGETARRQTGLVVAERYLCQPPEGCGHSWEVDTYGEGIYQDGGGS
jgi:transposase-like protein